MPKRHKVALIAEQKLIFCSQFLRDKRFGMEDMMKKNMFIIVTLVIAVIVCGVVLKKKSKEWSSIEFKAVVKENVTQSDGVVRLIVDRTTQIYGSPTNSLGISKETKLLDADGKEISINSLKKDTPVKVSLMDSSIEEDIFYYPTVYEIRIDE